MIDKILEEVFGELKPYINIYRLVLCCLFIAFLSPGVDVFFEKNIFSISLSDVVANYKEAVGEARLVTSLIVAVSCLWWARFLNKKIAYFMVDFNLGLKFFRGETVKAINEYNEFIRNKDVEKARVEIDDKIKSYKREKERILVLLEVLMLSFIVYFVSYLNFFKPWYLTFFVFTGFFLIYIEVVSYLLRRALRSVGFKMILTGEFESIDF